MKLYHIQYTSADFGAMPDKHRKLLLFLCAGISELNVLSKAFRFVPAKNAGGHHEYVAARAQAMILGQIYTGKLFEFWKTFQVLYFRSSLSKEFDRHLSSGAKTSLKALNKYFGTKSLIEKVRNNHAFHYSPDKVEAAQATFPSNEVMSLYLSDSLANSVFEFADLLYIHATLETVSPGDPKQAYGDLITETATVTGNLNQLVSELIAQQLKKYLPESMKGLKNKSVEFEGVKESDVPNLPFFIEKDD